MLIVQNKFEDFEKYSFRFVAPSRCDMLITLPWRIARWSKQVLPGQSQQKLAMPLNWVMDPKYF